MGQKLSTQTLSCIVYEFSMVTIIFSITAMNDALKGLVLIEFCCMCRHMGHICNSKCTGICCCMSLTA